MNTAGTPGSSRCRADPGRSLHRLNEGPPGVFGAPGKGIVRRALWAGPGVKRGFSFFLSRVPSCTRPEFSASYGDRLALGRDLMASLFTSVGAGISGLVLAPLDCLVGSIRLLG